MVTFGTQCKRAVAVAALNCAVLSLQNSPVSAVCSIQSSRLQQISEREIVAFIDGQCTREVGESGYFTEISPGVYGEVMAVYGRRNIDQRGVGWQSDYGYNVVFSDSRETYAAGVWIADEDGVVHSELLTIQNSFFPTTTTSTLPPASTSSTSSTSTVPGQLALPAPTETSTQRPQSAVPTTESNVVETDGEESDFAEISSRPLGNKWIIEIDSSYSTTMMTVKFRKSGSRVITWNVSTMRDGTRRILTSRNLMDGTLTLLIDGTVFDRKLVR